MKKSIIGAIAVVVLLVSVAPSSHAALVNIFLDDGLSAPGSSNTGVPYAPQSRDTTWDVAATAESGLAGIGAAVMEVRMITLLGASSRAAPGSGLGLTVVGGSNNAWVDDNQAVLFQTKFYSDLGKTTEITGVTSTFKSVTSRYWDSNLTINAHATAGAFSWQDNGAAGPSDEDYAFLNVNFLWAPANDLNASDSDDLGLTIPAPVYNSYNTINGTDSVVFGDGDTFWLRRENLNGAADGAYQLGAVTFDVFGPPNITLEQLPGTNALALTWSTDDRYAYILNNKTNLTDDVWSTHMTGIAGTGGDITVTTATEQVQNFYRVAGSINPNLMEYEAIVFCSDLQPRTGQLLFSPVEIRSVQRANRSEVFEEGTDYTVDTNGLITLPPGSGIPVLDYYAVVIDPLYRFTDTNGIPFYSPGETTKHSNYDVVVTYIYDHAAESLDDLAAGHWVSKLTNSTDLLQMQHPLNITFFGDSITYGAQASSLAPGAEPFAPAFPTQVTEALKARFGYDQINYANKAVGGTTSSWGLQEIQQVINTDPDLVVLAFGMNDAGGVPPATYKQNTEDMILALRAANAHVSIVLVAEFSPNPEWGGAYYSIRAENRDALYDLYSTYENMAFVDVGAVSRQVADKKKFQDFSGNVINHPNDFLHKIYAELILNVFE